MPPLPVPLVTSEWLLDHLGEPDLVIVDASWYLPSAGRDGEAEYLAGHIPGAVFWDLDGLSDPASTLPHTMPDPEWLAGRVGQLGIGTHDRVVVYDGSGVLMTAPRVWWMLRALGHQTVAVLDGGLAGWVARGGALESGRSVRAPAVFAVRPPLAGFVTLDQVREAVAAGSPRLVDARSPGRFTGDEPEPRPGLRSGHVPGSRSLHYASLVSADGSMLPPEELDRRFRAAGVDPDAPVITTCGSGVTACVLALALEVAGHGGPRVYDGSWTEWGGRQDTPVERGG